LVIIVVDRGCGSIGMIAESSWAGVVIAIDRA
jgi:hypothetical protein